MQSRECITCGEGIPEARLRAVPGATQCVRCLESSGDVPLVKRFDQQAGEETIEEYFITNRYIEAELTRRCAVPVTQEFVATIENGVAEGGSLNPQPVGAYSLERVIDDVESQMPPKGRPRKTDRRYAAKN